MNPLTQSPTRKLSLSDQLVLALVRLERCQPIDPAYPGCVAITDLTVDAWLADKSRWGLEGYEDLYPDFNRAVACLASRAGPIRCGYVERSHEGFVRLTPAGREYAAGLGRPAKSKRRPAHAPD